jgi:hypothetical protein
MRSGCNGATGRAAGRRYRHVCSEALSPAGARGDLLHRAVLEPVESRRILDHVDRVVRLDGGKEAIVMIFGGFLGFGKHRIAVPVEAMVLLGRKLEVLDFTAQQLGGFPAYGGTGNVLGADAITHMGLAHPSH